MHYVTISALNNSGNSPLIDLLDCIGRVSSEPWHLGIGHCDVRATRQRDDVVQEVTGLKSSIRKKQRYSLEN